MAVSGMSVAGAACALDGLSAAVRFWSGPLQLVQDVAQRAQTHLPFGGVGQ